MIKRLIIVLFLLVAASPTAFAAAPTDEAVSASKTWLAVIDGGKYGESWKDASDLFHQGVSQERWVKMVGGVREKLGPLQSRVFEAAELTKSMPGMPDGDYAIVSFKAVFDNKADATEVITLIREKGHWKAGGYFIR
jgi:opacity protein-like surface antigen